MKNYFRLICCVLFFAATSNIAFAVPPPDFIFNVGAQIVQIFSIVAIFFSAAFASIARFAKIYLAGIKHKYLFWTFLILIGLGVSFGAAFFYGKYEQDRAYQQWVAESENQNANLPTIDTSIDALKIVGTSTAQQAVVVQPRVKIPRPRENRYLTFIRTYYSNLANNDIEAAYAVSKKSVSLATFRSWYENVDSIVIDDIQEIEARKYSLSLTLTEGNSITRYGVLMTLSEDNHGNLSIQSSDVRVLSESNRQQASIPQIVIPDQNNSIDNSFFAQNQQLPIAIENADFKSLIDSNSPIFVLDAREDEEFAIGRFPNSTHIRFADLLAGEWISLPTDRVVYVFCWSGIRGKEVAEFLRSKNIVSQYVKNGADGWVSFGGLWEGGIKFTSVYTDARYTRLFNLNELRQEMASGTVIVDSRMNSKYNQWHIPGSINIPIIYTPTSRMDETLSEVPSGARVITVCDDFVSCFDAKITGVKLEQRGHNFLGRYNRPWEYRSSR